MTKAVAFFWCLRDEQRPGNTSRSACCLLLSPAPFLASPFALWLGCAIRSEQPCSQLHLPHPSFTAFPKQKSTFLPQASSPALQRAEQPPRKSTVISNPVSSEQCPSASRQREPRMDSAHCLAWPSPDTSLLLAAREAAEMWFLADLLEAAGALLFRYCLAHLQQPEMVEEPGC